MNQNPTFAFMPSALKHRGEFKPSVHYSDNPDGMNRVVIDVGPYLIGLHRALRPTSERSEYFRVTLAQTRVLDQQFRLAAKIGQVPLRAARLLATHFDVHTHNAGARLRCPKKLNGHGERQTLFPGVLHPTPHQNPLRPQGHWLCLLATSYLQAVRLIGKDGKLSLDRVTLVQAARLVDGHGLFTQHSRDINGAGVRPVNQTKSREA